MPLVRLALIVVLAAAIALPAAAADQRLDAPVRGKTLTLTVYRPAAAPRGTIFMGSGDVGWVGLAVSMSEHLSNEGYLVIGINVRQYLSAFTDRNAHLTTADIGTDFRTIASLLRGKGLLPAPVIVSGVSEGAGLAAAAASDPRNHDWIDGVITMGLPEVVELAWRWSDFTAWITKKDADEPSFNAREVVGGIAPRPLVLIQSTTDEYVPEADYRRLEAAARDPKKLILIDAKNHRFTDKLPELHAAYASALAWIAGVRAQGADR